MKTRSILSCAALVLGLAFAASCGGGGPALTQLEPEATDTAAMKAAKEKFNVLCWTCHGKTGAGDGPAAPPDPKPRSFGDKAWQASVTDEHLYNVILLGGANVGKSALMPPNPDLQGKDDVIEALIAIVRWFGTKS